MNTIGNETKNIEVKRTSATQLNNKLDQILVEQKAKGENYADWQKQKYPVKATRPFSNPDLSRGKLY